MKIPTLDKMLVKNPSPLVTTWLILFVSLVSLWINAPDGFLSISLSSIFSISFPNSFWIFLVVPLKYLAVLWVINAILIEFMNNITNTIIDAYINCSNWLLVKYTICLAVKIGIITLNIIPIKVANVKLTKCLWYPLPYLNTIFKLWNVSLICITTLLILL